MNTSRTRSWKQHVEGESINHADNSVGRSQPEALIIHTYTHIRRSRVGVLGPCSQQNTHHHHEEAFTALTSSCIHTHTNLSWEMIYFNRALDLSCNKLKCSGHGKRDDMGWRGEKNNVIPFLPWLFRREGRKCKSENSYIKKLGGKREKPEG